MRGTDESIGGEVLGPRIEGDARHCVRVIREYRNIEQ